MKQRVTRNSFDGGRNTDVDPSLINPNQYVEAHNVELVSEGGAFYAITDVKGTTEKIELTGLPTTCLILGSFANKYLIEGTSYRCITVFTAVSDDKFKIWCYNTETNTLYELYEEVIEDDYIADDRVIDAVNYPESGLDILYFTDNYNQPRYLRCEISSYVPNFLTSYQLSLLKKGATGIVELDSISSTGGALLSGTYQFAYRMADPTTKRFTKWSTPCNPIHIYTTDNSTGNPVHAGIGLPTTRKISLDITPSEIELDNFSYIQLAVIKNIAPTDPTTADLLNIAIANTVSGVVSLEYKANTSIGAIPLSDITVDLAQVSRVKTLNVKQNRLFAGNINYEPLEFDGGITVPPSPPTVPALSTWTNDSGATWTLGAVPAVTLASGANSGYILGAMATVATKQYSFTVDYTASGSGLLSNLHEVRISILDSGLVELDSALFSRGSGTVGDSLTFSLIPPTTGAYLAIKITNGTPFSSRDYTITGVSYNTPSSLTGAPTITSGTFITQTSGARDPYANDTTSSTYKGYFRDEVYRFGIVYTDEDGNKSTVSPLDFNGKITDNQISGALPDIRFPKRSTDVAYSLMDSSGYPKAIGLSFVGIKNHPSWAAGFEIVRLPRKKSILFQTPVIPMSKISGIGVLGFYPTSSVVAVGDSTAIAETPDAQPQTAGHTYVPKNLFWPELRETEKLSAATSGGFASIKGEVKLVRQSTYDYAMIFPQQSIYESGEPYVFSGNDKLDTVDYALLKVDLNSFETGPLSSNNGDFINTSVIGNFYAEGDSNYFFDSTTGGKSINSQFKNVQIADYEFFDNGGSPASVAGTTVLDYEALQTEGIDWGYQPTVQKSAVIKLQSSMTDLNNLTTTFKDGTLNAVTPGGYIFASSGPQYDTAVNNKYLTDYPSMVDGSSNISAVPVANIVSNLGDDRYGELSALGEYISTGAKHTFTAAERALLKAGTDIEVDLDVWGGDCFISYHSFKVCDSTYSIIGQNKYTSTFRSNQSLYWDRYFYHDGTLTNPSNILSMPIAVKNSAQFIQVLLESEFNGDVRDIEAIPMRTGSVSRFSTDEEEYTRIPLTYKYNINLNKENDQKIYIPKEDYSFEQNVFPARILYSDLKIYNSDQIGFDTIRVGNSHDLEESRKSITKLALASDQLYAIQEEGIVYIPTGENQVEQTTGGSLAVRSGDVIGRPLVIDAIRGSKHLRGIVETGGLVYVPDNKNKSVYIIANQEVRPITKDNESEFRAVFANQIPERNVIGIYDPVRRQYWIVDNANDVCHVYNEERGLWIANHEFTDLKVGVHAADNLYLIGNNTINTMYTGTSGSLFGNTVVPRVTVSINPDEPVSKTFDDMAFSASERLESVDLSVVRESSLGTQVIPTIDLDSLSIEGNYRVKVLRDASNARPRGLRATAEVKWKAETSSILRAILTKYRHSSRSPF